MVSRVQFEPSALGACSSGASTGGRTATAGTSFSSVLGEAMRSSPPEADSGGVVRISAHAAARMVQRSIALDASDHANIARAVDEAAAKGSKESLLIMDRLSLVVSVPNRTVITAVPRGEAADTIFTNIDSAVVVAPKASSGVESAI